MSNEIIELGGFAQEQTDIDGGYDEWCAFNYCLAEEYYWAMKDEAFDEIGRIDDDTLRLIEYWFNYNGVNNDNSEKNDISVGLIMTLNNRTFTEAVIANKIGCLASSLIANGNHDPRLITLAEEYYHECEKYYKVKVKED